MVKKSNYTVVCGFATGQDTFKTAKWFTKEVTGYGLPGKIVRLCVGNGYDSNNDICAHWVFSIKDNKTGKTLSIKQTYDAEYEALKIMSMED